MLGTIVLIVLVLLLLGALPAWPYSRGWGYAPTGIFGLLVVIALIMLLASMTLDECASPFIVNRLPVARS